jgi:hypothetical protein
MTRLRKPVTSMARELLPGGACPQPKLKDPHAYDVKGVAIHVSAYRNSMSLAISNRIWVLDWDGIVAFILNDHRLSVSGKAQRC